MKHKSKTNNTANQPETFKVDGYKKQTLNGFGDVCFKLWLWLSSAVFPHSQKPLPSWEGNRDRRRGMEKLGTRPNFLSNQQLKMAVVQNWENSTGKSRNQELFLWSRWLGREGEIRHFRYLRTIFQGQNHIKCMDYS